MTGTQRVVLDTNVVVSALVFAQGRLAPLRLAWQNAHFRPLVSAATAAELLRALAYPKFRLTHDEQQELLADYLPHCTAVRMPARAPRIPDCRDPHDRPFLELAVAGRAQYLVTGDSDLLGLEPRLRCAIVTPAAFLDLLRAG